MWQPGELCGGQKSRSLWCPLGNTYTCKYVGDSTKTKQLKNRNCSSPCSREDVLHKFGLALAEYGGIMLSTSR